MAFEEILKNLPDEPGVYMYLDTNGTVIYVGKARILKNRVRSYFHSGDLNLKTRTLVSNIADIKYIVTSNELEALLLENNLIKKYKPKYNILLKDDKGYPYLRIDTSIPYPKLEIARKLSFDGAMYFGPYYGAGSASAISDIALELYPLRTCNYDFSSDRSVRPCLKYHLGKCPSPCVEACSEQYGKNVKSIISFLRGNDSNALDIIRNKMENAAARLEFERAAELRDSLKRASEILNKQKIVLDKNQTIDVIGVWLKDTYGVICSMFIRAGRLLGVNTVEIPNVAYEEASLFLSKFLIQHYTAGELIPPEIVCSVLPDDSEIIEELLSDSAKRRVHIMSPQRGKRLELCQMALRNAKEKADKSKRSVEYRDERILNGLNELKTVLRLEKAPRRIECFDISHIQGTDTVASMVVFTNGLSDKKEYRRFKTHQGNNDFASMREVTERRYNDLLTKKAGFEKMPDLIVIDGGKGQLSSAREIICNKLKLDIPMIGLAERLEEIYLPEESMPIMLPFSSPALQILQATRDEAHRFAITFHKTLRGKHMLVSELDNISTIGATRKKALMKAFSTVARIKEASLEELEKVPSMTKASAIQVYEYFNKIKK